MDDQFEGMVGNHGGMTTENFITAIDGDRDDGTFELGGEHEGSTLELTETAVVGTGSFREDSHRDAFLKVGPRFEKGVGDGLA